MLELLTTDEFEKKFKELPTAIRKKAEKKEEIFRQNPYHPSLHTEKLAPKHKEVWSARIDREYRVIFRFLDNNQVLLLTCGHHNWIYRYKF